MARLIREVWTFGILSGAEKAQIGWYWLSPSSEAASALVAACTAANGTLWTTLRTTYNSQTAVTQIDFLETDVPSGTIDAVYPGSVPSPSNGSASGNSMPGQIAEVISIRTATPGISGRGRFYLPPWEAAGFTSAGQISSSYRTAVVNAFAAYVASVEGATTYELGVFSKKLGAFLGATAIDMGSVPDTQRRRRNKLVEGRYQVSV